MTKKRKVKADTLDGAVDLMNTAAPKLPEHIKLTPEEFVYFNHIIAAKAFESWNDVDLDIAANLARAKARIEKFEQDLQTEKSVKKNQANVKFKMVEDLKRSVTALTRMLQIHPLATVGQSKDQRKKNEKHHETQQTKAETKDNSLFNSSSQIQ